DRGELGKDLGEPVSFLDVKFANGWIPEIIPDQECHGILLHHGPTRRVCCGSVKAVEVRWELLLLAAFIKDLANCSVGFEERLAVLWPGEKTGIEGLFG